MSDETREPVPDEPLAEEPPVEEPLAEEPPVEEPLAEEPPVEEPPVEEAPSGELSDTGKIEAIREALEAEEGVENESEPEAAALEAAAAGNAATEPEAAAASEEAAAGEVPPTEMDLGPERRSNAWIWGGLAIGVLIAAGAIGYAWWYANSRPIVVPDIVGNVPAQAVQTLNDVDLRLGEITEEATEAAPPGTIVAQTPPALETLQPGDSVSLVVAAPPTVAKVPDVVGRSAEQAAEELAKAQLVAVELELYDPNVATGFVISQLPSAGVELPPGASVGLAVSTGPAPVEIRVPEIVGLPEKDAAALLEASDLRGDVYRSFDPSITAGDVIAQAPQAGAGVALDSLVQYLVSDGPGDRPVTVPDVKGRTKDQATKTLKAVPLKVQVREVSHPTVAKGVVITQIPEAGSKTARDAKVGILVSKGNLQRVPAPDVAGKTAEDAEKAAKSAGLTWLSVEIATSEHQAGLVFGQYPVAATEWPLRFPVIGVIAKAP